MTTTNLPFHEAYWNNLKPAAQPAACPKCGKVQEARKESARYHGRISRYVNCCRSLQPVK